MKKTLIVFILGVIFSGAASALVVGAKNVSLYEVERINTVYSYDQLIKYYDENANVVCYYTRNGSGSGFSCLKNN